MSTPNFYDEWRARNAQVYKELLEYVRSEVEGIVFPFIGAGLSKGAGIPLWKELLTEAIKDATLKGSIVPGLNLDMVEDQVVSLMGYPFYYELTAEFMAGAFTEDAFKDYVIRKCQVGAPTNLHHLISIMFPNLIVTTNYDTLLDMGRRVRIINTPQFVNHLNALPQSSLVKLHGTVNDPNSIVLARSKYDQVYNRDGPVYSALRILFGEGTPLFVGCSLRKDRFCNVLKEDAIARRKKFALLEYPDEPGAEADRQGMNLSIIRYPQGQYKHVELLFKKLAKDLGLYVNISAEDRATIHTWLGSC